MKTSEQITKITPAFLAAQKAIRFAVKDAVNPHLKSKYADLPAVIDAVKDALNSNGIAYLQTPGETREMHLAVTTRLLHESGEWLEGTLTMPIVKNDPQGFGSSLSYARRYALAAITGLYQDDDDGEAARLKRKAETTSPISKSVARDTFDNLGQEDQSVLRDIAMDAISYIAKGQLQDAYDFIESKELDADMKTGLWSLFDSKQRSGLRAISNAKKSAASN